MGWFSKAVSFVKNNVSEVVHGALDVAGFIPGVGAVADLANAALYAVEGDYANAAMSALAAIPGVGDTIALASKGSKVVKVAKGAKALSKVKKGKSLIKVIKGKAKVGGKLLKKLNPKNAFKSIKKGFKKLATSGKCFTGDTLVYTESGYVPIETVRIGDMVYSKNEETEEIGFKRVERISKAVAHTIYKLEINHDTIIQTTAYHSFYMDERGWVNAIQLEVGDELVLCDDKGCITSIEKERYEDPIHVYNLQVEDWHSYFVTKDKVYVHNGIKCIAKNVKNKVKNLATKAKQKIKCLLKGEPVDAVTGIVYNEIIDFELPGTIPIVWERRYYSDSRRTGSLGFGVSLNYETEIVVSNQTDEITLFMPDGRAVVFEDNNIEGIQFNREEQLTLHRIESFYEVFFHKERHYYVYRKVKALPDTYSLVEIRDEAGHKIEFSYDESNLISIMDSVGRNISIKNDTNNRISEVHIGTRMLVSYSYNNYGDLIRIKDTLGQKIAYEYKNHLLTKATTKDGYSFYWEYDGVAQDAKCIHTWGDDGTLDYHFEYLDGVTYYTNGLGYREAVYYNESNLITEFIDAEGNITRYKYNQFEELITVIDAIGGITNFTYDDKGNMFQETEPSGATTTFEFDSTGRTKKIIYPNKGEIQWLYNEDGNVQKVIYPDQTERKYFYNDSHFVSEVEDILGNKYNFQYDTWGNVIEVKQPDGSNAKWEYDEFGNCIKTINPLGAEQILNYDGLNRLIKADLPDGNSIQLKYNSYDEAIFVKDKLRAANFEYTWSGNIKTWKERDRKIEYCYDSEGQITSVINENGEVYDFQYDGNGNLIQEIGFDGIRFGYVYDGIGRVVKIQLPDGEEKGYEYDSAGNLSKIIHSDGAIESFNYNLMGSLTEVSNADSKINFELDMMEQVQKVTQDGYVIEYEYDILGRRTKITSSLGALIEQEYNSGGDISKISASQSDISWKSERGYNVLGQEISRYMPGNVKSSWEYDNAGRPIVQIIKGNDERKKSRKYKWDINNQLKAIFQDKMDRKFSYDTFGNLEWSSLDVDTIFRSMDAVGNIYKTKEHIDRHYKKGGQLESTDKANFQYDKLGNMVEKTTIGGKWKYQYYGNGLMSKVIRPDQKEVTFKYDGFGRRIEKVFEGKTKKFLWDGDVLLHEWYEENSTQENTITWVFDESSYTPFAKITEDKAFSIITDHLGTPIEMYDDTGEKVWNSEYDIYGKLVKRNKNVESCNFRYQGQYEDEETGLYYNRFRYYSSEDGIYTQQDPIRLDGGWSMYGYVQDTNTCIDPLGLAKPNGGDGGKHGGTAHNNVIDDMINGLKDDPDVRNLRKNQEQHKVNGKKAGTNKPDIQYDKKGKHYNIEVDTKKKSSLKHQNEIPKNDPKSRNTFWEIDKNGKKTTGHSQVPQNNKGVKKVRH